MFRGNVVKFRKGKVPQIGWNELKPTKKGILQNGYAYFVNSYYVVPKEKSIAVGETEYYTKFTSAVEEKNVLAVQFHPEKSGEYGLDILRGWVKCLQKE